MLAAWRRVDLTSEERAWATGTRSASSVLPGVLESLRLEARQAELQIVKVWNRVMDPHVASHAQPVGLRQGTLFVAVDNNVWLSEIVQYRQHDIMNRLRASFGSKLIRKISFRLA